MKLFAILLVSIPAAMATCQPGTNTRLGPCIAWCEANFSGSSQSCVRTACDTCTSS
ncbi:hypothetical protein HBH64_197570 [Parastagonospora nodorum]|nr:hypothetical protein HBH50_221270 [Parastagonospora nodorum]KAH4079913.1 hypothetical protein HBH48_214760 [Parastagonospora nodorum]KAH4181341.1 hypothetical protein HBH42_239990 [Parastagonospora nodorum]KAH4289708.1 hypothetical protein HBI02_204660 [Parastagonospora nodorum]KAH4290121.1 hypothetical protein HBI01_204740 [Parastagonospora nodorum]